jgi:hypothetical protein
MCNHDVHDLMHVSLEFDKTVRTNRTNQGANLVAYCRTCEERFIVVFENGIEISRCQLPPKITRTRVVFN